MRDDLGLVIVTEVARGEQQDFSGAAVDDGTRVTAGIRPVIPNQLLTRPSLATVARTLHDQVDVAAITTTALARFGECQKVTVGGKHKCRNSISVDVLFAGAPHGSALAEGLRRRRAADDFEVVYRHRVAVGAQGDCSEFPARVVDGLEREPIPVDLQLATQSSQHQAKPLARLRGGCVDWPSLVAEQAPFQEGAAVTPTESDVAAADHQRGSGRACVRQTQLDLDTGFREAQHPAALQGRGHGLAEQVSVDVSPTARQLRILDARRSASCQSQGQASPPQ